MRLTPGATVLGWQGRLGVARMVGPGRSNLSIARFERGPMSAVTEGVNLLLWYIPKTERNTPTNLGVQRFLRTVRLVRNGGPL